MPAERCKHYRVRRISAPVNMPEQPDSNEDVRRISAAFHTTHWSLVAVAGDGVSPNAPAALEKLCRSYWYPIYAEVRRRGFALHDAQDLTQEFFTCLLRRNTFAAARQDKGRFRSYLLGALNYFLADQWHRERAERRGGGAPVLSLDDPEQAEKRYLCEPASQLTPARSFDARWALTLMNRGFERLRQEYGAAGKSELFGHLKAFLAAESSENGYAEPATALGLTTSHVAVAVHRLRQRFRECVRAEVADTVANPAEVDEEMRHLFGGLK
jgi:DNA-directed RNA polymerase specialized sigma24 family protein